ILETRTVSLVLVISLVVAMEMGRIFPRTFQMVSLEVLLACIPSVRLGDRPRGGQKVLGPSSGRSGDISCCDVPTSGGVTSVVDMIVKGLVVCPQKSPIVELASTSSSSVPVPPLLD